MSNPLVLDFIAADYQKISEITLVNMTCSEFKTKFKKPKDFDLTEDILDDYLDYLLLKSLEEIDIKIKEGSIYVGVSDTRKDFGPVSIFFKDEDNHSANSLINGVVGSFTLMVKNKDVQRFGLGFAKWIEEIKVNFRIESRFDCTLSKSVSKSGHFLEEPFTEKTKPYFAATMLTYGKVDTFNESVYCDDNYLFDYLLIDILFRKIKDAYKKGFFRSYRLFEVNNAKVRGSIDIARHIKENAGRSNGKIAYRFRENVVNNLFNILVMKAFRHIRKYYPEIVNRKLDNDATVKAFFAELSYEVKDEEFSIHTAISKNLRPISHPYYKEYEDVRIVCLRILRNEGLSIFDSTQGEVNGFLYYLPDLWEDYLLMVFNTKKNDYTVGNQKKKKYLSSKLGNTFLCTSKPDFVFENKESHKVMILDAKLRPGWSDVITNENRFRENYNDNFSGDIDKCIRDMVVYDAVSTGVVFPMKEIDSESDEKMLERHELVRLLVEEINNEFYVIPHSIPISSNYNGYGQWLERFTIYRNRFREIITNELLIAGMSDE